MAVQNLAATVSGAASVSSASLVVLWGLTGSLAGESYTSADLTYKQHGLIASIGGEAMARGELSNSFAFEGTQLSGAATVEADLGVQRGRAFEGDECEFYLIESNGSSSASDVLHFDARWQRHVTCDDDTAEWTEGNRPDMSSNPTIIINPGAPITGGVDSSKLWIDSCSYNASVAWPLSGTKNKIIDAKFSGSGRGFTLTSSVENPNLENTGYEWVVPLRVYNAQYEGANHFDIRLADTSNTRGLRLGYGYKIASEQVQSSQSGTWSSNFHFTVPEELNWNIIIDYYIKTACDFDDPAQERNVAYIHHETNLTTNILDVNVDGVERVQTGLYGTFTYMDMDKGLMDAGMERHVTKLWEQLDNFVQPEEQWQMYPIRLDNISMQVTKQNFRIDFQLANQYPVLTYVDPFVDQVLDLFLASESPATITGTSSITEL